MTKFILHGGQTGEPSVHNDNFYREMYKGSKGKPVLAVYYSRPKELWNHLLASDKGRMKKAIRNRKADIVVASSNIRKFLKQLSEANAVYFRGGKTHKLKKKLKPVSNRLEKLFVGKTVLGSSAGAYFLSRYYMSSSGKIYRGFGILPIKTYGHYKGNKKNLDKLGKYREKLKTYAIAETEFVIINKG